MTNASLVPPIVIALAKHPLVDRYKLSLKRIGCGIASLSYLMARYEESLTVRGFIAGAAALGDGVAEIVQKKFGCIMRQGYGMTELSPVATTSSLRKKVHSSFLPGFPGLRSG